MFNSQPRPVRWSEYCCEYGHFDEQDEVVYETRCFLAQSIRHAETQALRHKRPEETIVGDLEAQVPEWN